MKLSTSGGQQAPAADAELLQLIKRKYESEDFLRRGVCLLNAGRYQDAEAAFVRAEEAGYTDRSLPSLIAACLLGQKKTGAAVERLSGALEKNEAHTVTRIRHALALWSKGGRDEAIESLRAGIRIDPECAELHFQLGMLLVSLEQYDEAELRFTQALNIDRHHTGALVNLALCCGVRNAPNEALAYLQRAQADRPGDPRIGMLLAQAAKAVQQQGVAVRMRAEMPDEEGGSYERGIEELARLVEADPDFIDAFVAIPLEKVDKRVFAMLLKTLSAALAHHPDRAELYHQRGRVLARLGRNEEAIRENERAVQLNPTFTRALIELGKLYQQTDRNADAATRLEQAIAAGADYADVHYLLGNLYRKQGKVGRARSAYRRALVLNDRYQAALEALEALPVP